MKKITLGILAHVDSGKTTLSEALLYTAGNIKNLGRVDNQNATLDTHALERKRGITIFSKQAMLELSNTEISLLDTPGHIDFSGEAERVLQVLDYAILVIDAKDKVRPYTKTLWGLLREYKIPTIIFVNKMDIYDENKEDLLKDIQDNLSALCIDFSNKNDDFYEKLALCNENLLNEILQNEKASDDSIRKAVKNQEIFPCFFGSALKLLAIDSLTKFLDEFTISEKEDDEFKAKVFKIMRDEKNTRLTFLKIISGTLKVKDKIGDEKINQIRVYSGEKFKAVDEFSHGGICCVVGLNESYIGQGVNTQDTKNAFLVPVMNYSVILPENQDPFLAYEKLSKLQDEDTLLDIVWDDVKKDIKIRLMGDVQTEVLQEVVKSRFDLSVGFSKKSVIYKETISKEVEGVGHFEPLGHYAEVRLLLTPLKRGEGVIIDSICKEDNASKQIQNTILSFLHSSPFMGALTGSELTDVKVSLVNVRHHVKHTQTQDFYQAAFRALQQALRKAENVLLEPAYKFTIKLPFENLGRLMSDMQKLSADFSPATIENDTAILEGIIPCTNIIDYNKELIAYTKARGSMALSFHGYIPCHNQAEVIKKEKFDYTDYPLANPDSVFFENGSGFIVPFDKVEQYAHTQSFLKEKIKEEEQRVFIQNAKTYQNTLEQDKELLKIFERTYGKIKTDKLLAFNPVKVTNPIDNIGIINSTEYLLVDGYNLIFAWEELSELAKDNIESARNKLLDILCNYQGFRSCEVVVVFDAYKVKGGKEKIEKYHNINVVYTKEAETADMYIEKTTKKIAKNKKVRVVTSDALQQMIILGHGALRVSSRIFKEEVSVIEEMIRQYCL